MLLGQKSQSQVTKVVYQAAGAGGVNQARTIAAVAVGLTSTATACRTKHER
jgi:stage V sporulation protein SpoVS